MTSVPFFLLFFAVVISMAMLKGGGPERVTAAAYVFALAASAYIGFLRVPGDFRVVPVGLWLVDSLLLIVLCVIAISANRWWTILAAGCQLVTVLVHLGKLIDPAMVPKSYELLTDIWSWPMVALLAIGTWAHRRRIAEGIVIPAWKPSLGRARSRSLPGRQPN